MLNQVKEKVRQKCVAPVKLKPDSSVTCAAV